MTYFRPEHCSEKVPGLTHYDSCGPCSALMLANAVAGANIHPSTLTEATRIRAAGLPGPVVGTSAPQLQRGLKNLYVLTTGLVETFPVVWSKLTPGTGAAAFGFLSNFPLGHRLRRAQPSYAGGHVVYVQREGLEDRVWWMDPLFPKGAYVGEWVTKDELATYQKLQADDSAVYATLPQEVGVPIYAPAKRMSVTLRDNPGTSVYKEPSLASERIGIIADPTRRFEVRALNPDGTWSCLVGLKVDGVTPDLSGPTLSAWATSDTLRDPKEIMLGGCTPAELAAAIAADRAKAKIVYI